MHRDLRGLLAVEGSFLAVFFKNIRNALSLSRANMAKRLGIPEARVRDIEENNYALAAYHEALLKLFLDLGVERREGLELLGGGNAQLGVHRAHLWLVFALAGRLGLEWRAVADAGPAQSSEAINTSSDALGRNLLSLRKAVGLTQTELSQRSGVTQSHISAIERGAFDPRTSTIQALAKALNVHPGQLFGEPSEK